MSWDEREEGEEMRGEVGEEKEEMGGGEGGDETEKGEEARRGLN